MQSQEFDINSIPHEFSPFTELDGNDRTFAGDERLHVTFRTDAIMNPFKSTQAGRQVFDEVDMIVIHTPGSQLTSVIAPMRGQYIQRFGDKYNKWKATKTNIESGTPLESFPFLLHKPGMVAELKAMNVHTVEQLATLPDSAKGNIMGGHELCARAASWIDSTSGTDATVAKMAKENDDLKTQMAFLQKQMEDVLKSKAETKKAA